MYLTHVLAVSTFFYLTVHGYFTPISGIYIMQNTIGGGGGGWLLGKKRKRGKKNGEELRKKTGGKALKMHLFGF